MAEVRGQEACIVIGAGMAGLMAARTLAARALGVTVLEKARGVGGRMATRWLEPEEGGAERGRAVWDHGAQFFTVRHGEFEGRVKEWIDAGVARVWARGFPGADGIVSSDGHPRYCGSAGMSAIPRHLSRGLDVKLNERVIAIEETGGRWVARLEGGLRYDAGALILTPPVPQSLALLDAGGVRLPPAARESLERIVYAPSIAILAHIEGPSRVPEPGGIGLSGEPIAWIADNRRKGISPEATTVTIHAGPEWSHTHWDADPVEVAALLLDASREWIGDEIRSSQVHRWRYSQPVVLHEERCLISPGPPPLVFAGDAFGEPRIEGAALSGLAAAEQLEHLISLGTRQRTSDGEAGRRGER